VFELVEGRLLTGQILGESLHIEAGCPSNVVDEIDYEGRHISLIKLKLVEFIYY
jgi:hypothetical protein